MRIIESNHNISLIRHNTLLSTLKQSLFLHQFKCIKSTCTFQSCKKDSTEPSSSNTFDDLEIFQLNIIMIFLSPDRFYLNQLPFKYFNRLVSLEIVIFENITSTTCPPVTYTRWSELVVI